MSTVLSAVAIALFAWWFGTGVILYLDGLHRRTHAFSMLLALTLALAALLGLAASRHDLSAGGAVTAFVCAIVVWGALEMSYLLGFVTGTHQRSCPERCSEPRRFLLALGSIIYHELVVVLAAGLLALIVADGPNRIGFWTFLVLWLMRWSAKLNLFLGVSNFHPEWLPRHLRYVVTYVKYKPMNLLFPISVSVATAILVLLFGEAFSPLADEHQQMGYALVGSLLALATLEHWFLVLPVPDAALWRWALTTGSRGAHGELNEPRESNAHT